MKIICRNWSLKEYPYINFAPDASFGEAHRAWQGNLHVVYDRERSNRAKLNKETWVSQAAKEIFLCKITVDDVINNTLAEGSFLQKILSKASVDYVEA